MVPVELNSKTELPALGLVCALKYVRANRTEPAAGIAQRKNFGVAETRVVARPAYVPDLIVVVEMVGVPEVVDHSTPEVALLSSKPDDQSRAI